MAEGGSVDLASEVEVACPSCGLLGHVEQGVYTFTQGLLKLARTQGIESLKAVHSIFAKAQQTGADQEDVAAQLVAQPSEEVRALADLLPKKRSEWLSYISMVLAVLLFVITKLTSTSTTNNTYNSKSTTNNTYNFNPPGMSAPPSARKKNPRYGQPLPKSGPDQPFRRVAPKVGRNDLCHCGSGAKMKKCHPD